MSYHKIIEGVIIGAVGGACAGLAVSLVEYLHRKIVECADKNRVYSWLLANTKDTDGERYRGTRTIASYNNVTEDRARYICSIHEDIYLSTGEKTDLWGIYGISGRRQ